MRNNFLLVFYYIERLYYLSMVRRHQLWQVWAGSNANEGPPASMAFLNENNSIAIEKVVIDWLFL